MTILYIYIYIYYLLSLKLPRSKLTVGDGVTTPSRDWVRVLHSKSGEDWYKLSLTMLNLCMWPREDPQDTSSSSGVNLCAFCIKSGEDGHNISSSVVFLRPFWGGGDDSITFCLTSLVILRVFLTRLGRDKDDDDESVKVKVCYMLRKKNIYKCVGEGYKVYHKRTAINEQTICTYIYIYIYIYT